MGIYRDADEQILPPLKLEGTDMLPSLEGKYYDKKDDEENSFPPEVRRYLKRTKIDFVIIKKESDETSKYEIFQRLNTGGTSLSDQEVRNCLMVMENSNKFNILQNLSTDTHFINTLRLSDKNFEERYDLELVTRFVCLRTENIANLKGVSDFGHYLDKRIIAIFRSEEFDWDKEIEIFKKTFQMIDECMGDSAFLKYDVEKEKFTGRFYTSAFEFVAIGLGRKEGVLPLNFNLKEQVIELWKDIAEQNVSWKGFNAAGRLGQTLKLVDKLYSDE